MTDAEERQLTERILNFLKEIDLDQYIIAEVRIGKTFDSRTYQLNLHLKNCEHPGFIMITMQLPEGTVKNGS